MNNKVLCCLICVVVIIILVIMIVTHKKENFNVLGSAGSSYSNEYSYKPPENINSIVSKIDGTILNVNVVNANANDKIIKILTDDNGTALCMVNTNNLSKCDDEDTNEWKLKFINDANDMNTLLKNTSRGQSSTMVNYPFYMVLTSNDTLALQYNNGRFSVSPVGNYDSQKWDVSNYKIPQIQLFVNDIYDSPLDKMPYSQDSDPNNRVKINLNVNDERLKELLNIKSDNTSSDSNNTCDRYIPKDAVKNLCSGCKV